MVGKGLMWCLCVTLFLISKHANWFPVKKEFPQIVLEYAHFTFWLSSGVFQTETNILIPHGHDPYLSWTMVPKSSGPISTKNKMRLNYSHQSTKGCSCKLLILELQNGHEHNLNGRKMNYELFHGDTLDSGIKFIKCALKQSPGF